LPTVSPADRDPSLGPRSLDPDRSFWSACRRVIPSIRVPGEGSVASRPHRPRRERTGARSRVARECHPAVATSPKAVAWSWDRGRNDHRILRRISCRRKAPRIITERPGHAGRSRVVFGVSSHLPTHPQRPKADVVATKQPSRRRGRRKRREGATGVSEARSHQRRGKKTPTLVSRP
jgi:hypothetical protein